jgi:hypothetical protein
VRGVRACRGVCWRAVCRSPTGHGEDGDEDVEAERPGELLTPTFASRFERVVGSGWGLWVCVRLVLAVSRRPRLGKTVRCGGDIDDW